MYGAKPPKENFYQIKNSCVKLLKERNAVWVEVPSFCNHFTVGASYSTHAYQSKDLQRATFK